LAVSLCFLVTHTSFYWLGGRVPHPSVAGWWAAFARWYPDFLGVSFIYLGIAVALHVMLACPARSPVRAGAR
jgi:hypothetical protein